MSVPIDSFLNTALFPYNTAFTIFVSEQGNQGLLGQASKQQLDTVFGTTKEDEAVKKLLELGTAKPGDALPKGYGGTNDTL